MNFVRKISTLMLMVLYLGLSVGIVLYHSHCDCKDNDRISLFVQPEPCSEDIIEHDCCNTEKELNRIENRSTHHCGCETPSIFVLRLQNHWSEQNDDIKIKPSRQLTVPLIALLVSLQTFGLQENEYEYPNYSPPAIKKAGRILINFIEQRKIAIYS